MKKIILLLVVMATSFTAAFAEAPKYFAFEIGSGAAYDVDSGDILASNGIGFTYSFSDSFIGGFSFKEIGGNSIDTINIGIVPANNVTLTMYTGQITTAVAAAGPPVLVAGSSLAFGVGIGYDFFVNAKTLFTSVGLYLDWYAAGDLTSAYALERGGIISMGLKTKIGL